ncbi:MAG TPA: hypothetical protein VGG61_01645 [Gemmataceae bacterium]|jgi:hypothetical protein
MSLAGHIENGVVVFEQPVSLANGTPVRVEVVGERLAPRQRPAPGLGKGSILYLAPDFEETPEEFKE